MGNSCNATMLTSSMKIMLTVNIPAPSYNIASEIIESDIIVWHYWVWNYWVWNYLVWNSWVWESEIIEPTCQKNTKHPRHDTASQCTHNHKTSQDITRLSSAKTQIQNMSQSAFQNDCSSIKTHHQKNTNPKHVTVKTLQCSKYTVDQIIFPGLQIWKNH